MTLTLAASLINFGALIAFLIVNIAVIYFTKNKNRSISSIILYLTIPSLGSIFIIYLLFNLDTNSIVFGIIWGVLGVFYLIYLVKFKGMERILYYQC